MRVNTVFSRTDFECVKGGEVHLIVETKDYNSDGENSDFLLIAGMLMALQQKYCCRQAEDYSVFGLKLIGYRAQFFKLSLTNTQMNSLFRNECV